MRRGISLIEILFSIGIVSIGLLGVLAIVPVSLYQVRKGGDLDRSSRLGLNALSEFEIRGMANLNSWRYMSSPGTFVPVAPPLNPQQPFAIDPLALSLPANQTAAGAVFPAGATLSMPRYSLRSLPLATASAMSSLQADRLFIMRDDLILAPPDVKSNPPLQVFNWLEGPDGAWGVSSVDDDQNGTVDDASEAGTIGSDDIVVNRQTDGVYSWMATMTPKLDSRYPLNYPDNFAQDYTLSIVVFHGRDFSVTNGSSERAVDVATIYGDGTGGGEMLLRTKSTSTTAADDLRQIREGTWLLLGGNIPAYPLTSGQSLTLFSWYRVDSADDEIDPQGTDYELNVSLSGPDWPVGMMITSGPATTGTQAIIVKNVIAVYQKTIRLETSSLWSS